MPRFRVPHLPRRAVAGLAAIATVAIAVAAIIATAAPGSSEGAKSRSALPGATTVQRRNLVETDTESGTLSYAKPQTVFNRMSGTITWLPAIGLVIRPGQTLYEVDNQPVVLLNGSTPAFRDLSAADSAGPDILELNRALAALGFDAGEPITLNDTWQTATTDAVERWQGSLGFSETGVITLGQVVFLPGAQRVTAIDTALGSTGGSSGAGGSTSASSASTAVVAGPEFVSLTTTTPRRTPAKRTGSSTTATLAELKALEALLKSETQELRSQRTTSATSSARSGTGSAGSAGRSTSGGRSTTGSATSTAGATGSSTAGASAQAIMQTSSTQLVVTVDLDASKQSEAVLGEPVTVQMPGGSTVGGKITAVSPVAQASSSSSSSAGAGGSSTSGGSSASSATVPVTVTLTARLPTTGLDQAAVSVSFEQQVENNVLSVPVTALLATQGGGYAVQEAAPPHRLLAVSPGLFAAGYVQVSGSGIYPGLQVTDSQG